MIALSPCPLVVSSLWQGTAREGSPTAAPGLGWDSGYRAERAAGARGAGGRGAGRSAARPLPAPPAQVLIAAARAGGEVAGRDRGWCRSCLPRTPRPRAAGARPPPWCPVAAAGRGGPVPGAEQLRGCDVFAGEGGPDEEAVRAPAAAAARVHRGGGRGRAALLPVRRRYGAQRLCEGRRARLERGMRGSGAGLSAPGAERGAPHCGTAAGRNGARLAAPAPPAAPKPRSLRFLIDAGSSSDTGGETRHLPRSCGQGSGRGSAVSA